MKHYLAVFLLCFTCWASGQTKTNEGIPLSLIVEKLELEYRVSISYNAELLLNRYGQLPQFSGNLLDDLEALEKRYKIRFIQIDQSSFVINEVLTQDVCGFLLDATKNPLTGAIIYGDSNEVLGVSDQEGFFKINDVSLKDSLTLNYFGHLPLILSVGESPLDDCPELVMAKAGIELKEVVVEDYLVPGVLKQRDGSMKITPKRLETLSGLGEPDVLLSAQLLPGITSPTETASGIFVRGGTPDQNLILWDGIKLYNSDHFFGVFSLFNPYVVESIEVFRGAANAKYGDRIAGVLDIKTTRQVADQTSGGAGLNFNTIDGFLNSPLSQNSSLHVSVRRSLTDLYNPPFFQNFSDRVFQNTSVVRDEELLNSPSASSTENTFFYDAHFKFNYAPSDQDHLALSTLISKNRLDFDLNNPDFPEFSRDDFLTRNSGVNLQWIRTWKGKLTTSISAYRTAFKLNYSGLRAVEENQLSLISEKTNSVEEIGFSIELDKKINPSFNWGGGFQFFNPRVQYGLVNEGLMEEGDDSNAVNALYGYGHFEKNKWLLRGSLRASQFVALKAYRLAPRLFAEYRLGPKSRLTASWEIRNQSVSQIIEFATQDFGLVNQLWVVADEEVFPILKSKQASFGFLYKKGGLNVDLEAYTKHIDGITSLSNGFNSASTNFSNGESNVLGIDLLIKNKWRAYSTFLGYTLSNSNFKFDSLNEGKKFKGNNDIRHSITWSHSLKLNVLELSLGWNFRTGIPYTGASLEIIDGDPDIILDQPNNKRLPSYHRADVSAWYQFSGSEEKHSPSIKIGLSVLNLYGRKNVLSREFGFADELDANGELSTVLEPIDVISLGITPNLAVRLNF